MSAQEHPPELRVRYQCPVCGRLAVLDPYVGPPRCRARVSTLTEDGRRERITEHGFMNPYAMVVDKDPLPVGARRVREEQRLFRQRFGIDA